MNLIINAIKQQLSDETSNFQSDYQLPGQSKLHSIDFSYRITTGKIEHLVLVDLKRLDSEKTAFEVCALHEVLVDCGASNAVLVSTKQFTPLAVEAAKALGITLMILKDLGQYKYTFHVLNYSQRTFSGNNPIDLACYRYCSKDHSEAIKKKIGASLYKFYTQSDFDRDGRYLDKQKMQALYDAMPDPSSVCDDYGLKCTLCHKEDERFLSFITSYCWWVL